LFIEIIKYLVAAQRAAPTRRARGLGDRDAPTVRVPRGGAGSLGEPVGHFDIRVAWEHDHVDTEVMTLRDTVRDLESWESPHL
jgi:hypothetical protein